MSQGSNAERKSKIRELENELIQLLTLLEVTTELDSRLQLWWQVEKCRSELETQGGDTVPRRLDRLLKSAGG